jgi:hypothetical protein
METMTEFREFDSRLNSLEGRMGAVENTLANHGALLLEIKSAVTEERASRGPGISDIIRTVSSLATTAAIIATLLIYVATSVMSGPVTRITERQEIFGKTVEPVAVLITEMAVAKQRLIDIERRLASNEFIKGWQPVADLDARPNPDRARR